MYMKWPQYALLWALTAFSPGLFAQVKIGDNPQDLDPLSLLELESTNRVMVINRMSNAQMNALSPLAGALVYNTDKSCLFSYDGNVWNNLCLSESLTITDNMDGSITISEAGGAAYTLTSNPATNQTLEFDNGTGELTLTDTSGGTVSTTINLPEASTITVDAVVNDRPTLLLTQDGLTVNLEVLEITGDQIVNQSINGFNDIQGESIGADNLAANSVGKSEIAQDAVGDEEIDYTQVTLSDFQNDAGYITTAVSAVGGNDITDNGGAYYDDSALSVQISEIKFRLMDAEMNIGDNLIDLDLHLNADQDLNNTNEIQVLNIEGNSLSLSLGGGSVFIDSDPNNELSDLQIVGDQLFLTNGIPGAIGADLAPYLDNTDQQTAAEVPINDLGADYTANEVQTALEELAAGIAADLDDDPNNELSDLQIVGDQLFLTNGIPGAIGADLAPYLDNQTAAEVDIADAGDLFVAEQVEGALAELAGSVNNLEATTTIRAIRAENQPLVAVGPTDYTVILNPGTNAVNLPDPVVNEGRIVIIKNISGGNVTTNVAFNDAVGAEPTVIPVGIVQLQSDGTIWHQIN